MELFYVDDRTVYGDIGLDTFHHDMFHGVAERTGATDQAYHVGVPLTHKLHIQKNVYNMPAIFSADAHLVLSQEVREKLEALEHIAFLPVVFDKLFSYPYKQHDFSYWERMPYASGEKLLARFPHDPSLEGRIPPYYELIEIRRMDIVRNYRKLKCVPLQQHRLDCNEPDQEDFYFSDEMLQDYPVLWEFGHILNRRAFEILKPYIDPVYFVVAHYTV